MAWRFRMEVKKAPVYPSLVQKPMLLGVPQQALFLLLLLAAMVAVASQFNTYVLLALALAYFVVLPMVRRAFENEPFLLEIMQNYFSLNESMPSHGLERKTPWVDKVPKPWEG